MHEPSLSVLSKFQMKGAGRKVPTMILTPRLAIEDEP